MKRWITSKGGVKYELSPKEEERFQVFKEKCKPHPVSIKIEETHIGFLVTAVCNSLKIERSITDYSRW